MWVCTLGSPSLVSVKNKRPHTLMTDEVKHVSPGSGETAVRVAFSASPMRNNLLGRRCHPWSAFGVPLPC